MKLSQSLILLVAGCTAANAFQPTTSGYSRPSTHLFANSQNIRAAMEATEMYGATSPQARLAWETVEEFDGNDNTAAFSGNEENKWSDEDLEAANQEIMATLEMVQRRTENLAYNQFHMKDVAAELQAIKLTPPEKKPAPVIPGLWDAKLKARAMSQQYGNASQEARLSWEEVEEIASAGLENAIGGDKREECLVVAAEACMALEELERFLWVEYDKETGGAQY